MALLSRMRSSGRLKPLRDRRLVFQPEQCNVLLYPFDSAFFEQYGRFTDKINRIERVFQPDLFIPEPQEDRDSVLSILTPFTMVDIMLQEYSDDMGATSSICDMLYEEFEESLVNDVVEEIYGFFMKTLEPYGFWDVLEVLKRNETAFLGDFFGAREDDSMVYVLHSSE